MSQTIATAPIDVRALRDCCGSFATGVTVVTTRTAEGVNGMTVNAFMSVSLDPPLISIALGRGSKMQGKIRKSGRYAVNVLTAHMRPHALHFAGRPDATLNNLFQARQGLPVLRGAAAVLVADVVQQIDAGDHVLFLSQFRDLERDPEAAPLLYHAGQFGNFAADSVVQTL